jgi:hypothetical protein
VSITRIAHLCRFGGQRRENGQLYSELLRPGLECHSSARAIHHGQQITYHPLAVYGKDELRLTRYRRLKADDPDLQAIRTHWEQSLRRAVQELPGVTFDGQGDKT